MTSSRTTIEDALETVFPTRSVPICYKKDNWNKSLELKGSLCNEDKDSGVRWPPALQFVSCKGVCEEKT
jgi:hypothetical protein